MDGNSLSLQQSFHQFATGLHKQTEPVALVHHLLSGLHTFIPTQYNSWKEINLHNGQTRITGLFSPDNRQAATLLPVFQRHVAEHPVCNHWRRSGHYAGAFSWSDVASRSDIERLPLYSEFYRPLGIQHQMMIALESKPSHLIYLALNRSHAPFTEQERQLLGFLQPHVTQALHHLQELYRLRSTLTSFETLVNTLNQGVLCLSAHNRIKWASARARDYLRRYCDHPPTGTQLPEALLAWITTPKATTGTPRLLPGPLSIHSRAGQLTARLLAEKQERYIFLEETPAQPMFEAFKQAGLTEREAEVLGWVAQGKSNDETAAILKVCSQTIKKHLERIYSGLGVTNRTEAALKAHALLRRSHKG